MRSELLNRLVAYMNQQRHNIEDYIYIYESDYDDPEFKETLLQDQKATIIKYRDTITKLTRSILTLED